MYVKTAFIAMFMSLVGCSEVEFSPPRQAAVPMARPDNATCVAPDLAAGEAVAANLSASGCVDTADATKPYKGLYAYDINSVLWSDGATKERFIALPNSAAIAIDENDDWVLPPGTVIVKNFRLNDRLVETRHLMLHPDGQRGVYSYEWNEAGTDAMLVVGGKTKMIDGYSYYYPSEEDCLFCHNDAAKFALGPETAQLNRDYVNEATGQSGNQLEAMDRAAMFTTPLAGTPETLPVLADPHDLSANLDDRARAYLHVNCAICHQPGGPTPAPMDFRYFNSLLDTNACDVAPTRGDLGIENARIIAPGNAARSIVVERMSRRDHAQMPPIATSIPDAAGIDVVTNWINSLVDCG